MRMDICGKSRSESIFMETRGWNIVGEGEL